MLDYTQAKFDNIFSNNFEEEELKDYLVGLYNKGEEVEEIVIAAKAMRKYMIELELSDELKDKIIDNCGTGGDKSSSFNISTTCSFLLSSGGCFVAKHGNISLSSKSGSANVLEALGLKLDLSNKNLALMLEDLGFCFMFAKNHHVAMKHIMLLRAKIPHRTIFNILGPLSNPAGADKNIIGVFSKDYLAKLIQALKGLGSKKALLFSSKDLMDEISISDITYANSLDENGEIKEFIIDPREYGLKFYKKEEIIGGTPEVNAKITRDILSGVEVGAKRDIVLINSAFAFLLDGKVRDIKEGIEYGKDLIKSKKAITKLDDIIKASNKMQTK